MDEINDEKSQRKHEGTHELMKNTKKKRQKTTKT